MVHDRDLLSYFEQKLLDEILNDFCNVFPSELPYELPLRDNVHHYIDLILVVAPITLHINYVDPKRMRSL